MGVPPQVLPTNILKWMNQSDRRKYAKGQCTVEELIVKVTEAEEKDLHDKYTSFLNRMELQYCHSTWGKKATIQPGLPDFHVWKGRRHAFVEFKGEHGRLSDIQKQVIAKMLAEETPVLVTNVYIDAVRFTIRELGLVDFDRSQFGDAYPEMLGPLATSPHATRTA